LHQRQQHARLEIPKEVAWQLLHVQVDQFLVCVPVLQIFNVASPPALLVPPMERVAYVFQLQHVLGHLLLVFAPVLLTFDAVLLTVVQRVLLMDCVEAMLVLLLVQSKAIIMWLIQ
jgi:hypothetical protein